MENERMMHRKNLQERIEELTILRNESELSLLKAGCLEFINEMTDNPFLWIPLLSQEHPSLCYQKAIQDSSEEPYLRLAGLLEFLLKNLIPKELQMQGSTIRIQENKCHYCISGSISLDDLYKLCEHHQVDLDCANKK